MEKTTLVATGLMILLYIFLEHFGIIQHGVKLTAFYFQFLKNDYLLILSLALSASIVLLPASLYLFALQKSIKEMMEYFQVIQQKHKNCCCPSDRRFCKTYFQELSELRKGYKNINQTIVIGAILYQVAALGFFFRVVNHINLPDPSFVIIDSVSLTKWTLLFFLTIILLMQFWSYFTKIFKKQGYTQKFISLSLIVISIFWVATFQLSEMLFLFILVLIQLMGSALLKKFELQPTKMNQKEGRSRMNRYQKIAIGVMLFVPLIFLIVSLLMDRWGFFLWSLAPSFVVGMTGFFVAKDK